MVPIVRKQANAFLRSGAACPRRALPLFRHRIKRLITNWELDDVAIFLVHLS